MAKPRTDKTVALCVTGSIAAYKSVEVARRLVGAGVRVLPVMTRSAARFLGPVTLSGITGNAVADDMWDPSFSGEKHVVLAEAADLVAIVPATADVLARLAHGRADDLVTALALSAKGPVLAAPAMFPRMWDHPATRANVATLAAHGRVELVGPVSGPVASGDVGMGRMAEPEAIVAAILARLGDAHVGRASGTTAPRSRDLDGVRVLVTAGPTLEDFDPVRYLGNRSTGKMGFAIAESALARGAEVTLVAGPVILPTPEGVRRVDVRSAESMRAAMWDVLGERLEGVDVLVMTAAVGDYRPAEPSATKTKKTGDRIQIDLVKNPDLIGEVGAKRASGVAKPVLVAFAVESGDDAALVAYARKKLVAKRVDLVVANEASQAFGGDDNRAIVVGHDTAESHPRVSKRALADVVLDAARRRLGP